MFADAFYFDQHDVIGLQRGRDFQAPCRRVRRGHCIAAFRQQIEEAALGASSGAGGYVSAARTHRPNAGPDGAMSAYFFLIFFPSAVPMAD